MPWPCSSHYNTTATLAYPCCRVLPVAFTPLLILISRMNYFDNDIEYTPLKSTPGTKKAFRCGYEGCLYEHSIANSMLRHQRIMHTKEKPYKCPHCSYRCTETSGVTKHIGKHSIGKQLQHNEPLPKRPKKETQTNSGA